MSHPLTRRAVLGRAALLGCSAAASPLLTPLSLAAAPWDTRIVVIILRGGMDGLDVIRPYGDPNFATLRQALAGPTPQEQDLDGFYALHPALSALFPLWKAGELGFVNAVSTPYRDKRSHFDGQDILEAGTQGFERSDGWLNRLLQTRTDVMPTTAYAVGRGDLKVLLGEAEVADWTPEAAVAMSPQALRLAELVMADDPAFHAALNEAVLLSGDGLGGGIAEPEQPLARDMMGAVKSPPHVRISEFVGEKLRQDTRIAAFSISGWDTHSRQSRALKQSLGRLGQTILTLKKTCGPGVWARTCVLAMTEFGRTAALNGTGGTDHGTGGAMIYAGGAVRGGQVLGQWPGLAEEDLYNRRDLMPTRDIRAPIAWALHAATGCDRALLETSVFPGLDMMANPGIL